jgi:hypothetical protein
MGTGANGPHLRGTVINNAFTTKSHWSEHLPADQPVQRLEPNDAAVRGHVQSLDHALSCLIVLRVVEPYRPLSLHPSDKSTPYSSTMEPEVQQLANGDANVDSKKKQIGGLTAHQSQCAPEFQSQLNILSPRMVAPTEVLHIHLKAAQGSLQH